MRARLISYTDIGPEVRHFLFEIPDVARLDFKPGQFLSLSETIMGKKITRAYSIASEPRGDNKFELCLNRVKEGKFSPWLFELQPGGEINVRGPVGLFVPKAPLHDALFIATGTGIAPFRSMLRSPEVLGSGKQLTLLFGARYEEGLVYREEFIQLGQRFPNFRFIPTITRPEPTWTGRTGWVQSHLDEALAGRNDVDVYICGLKAMVDEVREILTQKGFEKQQIVFEKYD